MDQRVNYHHGNCADDISQIWSKRIDAVYTGLTKDVEINLAQDLLLFFEGVVDMAGVLKNLSGCILGADVFAGLYIFFVYGKFFLNILVNKHGTSRGFGHDVWMSSRSRSEIKRRATYRRWSVWGRRRLMQEAFLGPPVIYALASGLTPQW